MSSYRLSYSTIGLMCQCYVAPDLARAYKMERMSYWQTIAVSFFVAFAWPAAMPLYVRKRELGEV
ncbi:hypothetical protein [Brazilian marseillevirus]|uniref:hypothetical protein n=1 Tax=Brazilian marseillevirus TaxID=1813599 RepID=UPI000782A976|nr:hypothetical protein A3303_gp077 [Brazilian marseillevirus]AMQ10585.1 hypothetical protein [Brazilian marseillevirus]